MGTVAAEKTEEELRKEIEELNRQKWEITERLRDPRGLRRGGLSGPGPRNFIADGGRQRGFLRPAERTDSEDQPPQKRRLSSAIVKAEDGEIIEDAAEAANNAKKKDSAVEGSSSSGVTANQSERKPSNLSRRDGNQRPSKMKFRKEDKQLSGTEAYMRRSNSLQRAEQRAREESERLRQQEREQIAEKRRRDLTLRARVAAKAEEKKLELLFLRWSEHQRKLGNFLRTKAEPPIYYMFSKPMDDDAVLIEQQKEQTFQAWKDARREELSQYQKQIGEQYLANVEKELERWQNARKARKPNNDMLNLQETMDKELETHRLEHGPKTRKIPSGSNNQDEDDVEDINVGEDDMMDDVLEVDENNRTDETVKPETGNGSPHVDNTDQ
ncbi:hypothetical protein HYC85_024375 [Camellia sinensis]|uniref:Pinin/SDK/MemA protein domain-containing protein n=1 Tax=Camellia sinensis TaxID=4442 RepID=A0A7J7G801_CAMSI|nr:hypothetical protein HYC85_024375 [Camellia sinensis]